jgi:hypothetical protein
VLFDQVAAPHVRVAQEVPVQPSPATRYPIHIPPDQEVPLPARFAQAVVDSGPQTENSPVSGTLSYITRLEPRARSSVPAPDDLLRACVCVGVALRARAGPALVASIAGAGAA